MTNEKKTHIPGAVAAKMVEPEVEGRVRIWIKVEILNGGFTANPGWLASMIVSDRYAGRRDLPPRFSIDQGWRSGSV